ncbi:ABC transporter permease [Nocardioides sp. L-11A]|uniref:ABC transporter permease n=1 Tax=Nocardioides sp. L-11A TaxID=3043848 RepID=UPI002499B0BF|nr:ABC transporter permease [Nocardioides sp. L-11A]
MDGLGRRTVTVRELLRTVGAMCVSILAASFVVFASLYAAPGDAESVLFGSTTPTDEVRAAVREQYRLDDPFLIRYLHWLGSVAHGDFGTSFVGGQSVATRLGATAPTTLALVGLAGLLLVMIGIAVGVPMGLRPGRLDTVLTTVVAVVAGIPTFVSATLLIAVFAVGLGWFPAYGADGLRGLVLPALSLALVSSAMLARVTRASVRAESGREYVTTARARGLPARVVVARHILPNAAGPVITAGGLLVAALFAGAIVVENAFGIAGLGSLLVSSVNRQDFPTVQAISLLLVVVFVVTNTLVDLAARGLDPRQRRRAA